MDGKYKSGTIGGAPIYETKLLQITSLIAGLIRLI